MPAHFFGICEDPSDLLFSVNNLWITFTGHISSTDLMSSYGY